MERKVFKKVIELSSRRSILFRIAFFFRFTFVYLASRMDDLVEAHGDDADGVWRDFYKRDPSCEGEVGK